MSRPVPDPSDVFAPDCPVRPIYGDITSRWATLVLAALAERPHRFSHLADRIGGVSEKMLSQTLRALTRDGLVTRTVTPTVPIQVTYNLTALGVELIPRLLGLVTWVSDHTAVIRAAQVAYDADTPVPPATANRRWPAPARACGEREDRTVRAPHEGQSSAGWRS